jgi:hypothetical protein
MGLVLVLDAVAGKPKTKLLDQVAIQIWQFYLNCLKIKLMEALRRR